MNSVGVDIIEVGRIERAIRRWGERFLGRVFTPAELELCRETPGSLAARFAAKEAVMKALGGAQRWREIEVLRGPRGQPRLRLWGRARARARRLGLELVVSLSHCQEYAIASVVGNRR
jgi:holo-[acyl-carrier protein] synthase